MNKQLLFSLSFLSFTAFVCAQRSNSVYAISAHNQQTTWVNIQLLNGAKGEVQQTVFDPSKQQQRMIDFHTNSPVAASADGMAVNPTATTAAAAAFDELHQRFFFIPLRIAELRWADLRSPASPQFYTLSSPILGQLDMNNAANHITRMVIGADQYGYAITNDGNHFYRFTTGKKPGLTDMGGLSDAPGNGPVSVHDQNSSWGGDLVAGTDELLYLITYKNHVFSIDPTTRIATYRGVINGLPQNFSVNGAAVDAEGRVLVSCSFGDQAFYQLDLETLAAKPAYKDNKRTINASDLASGNLATRPAINRGQYIQGRTPFGEGNQTIAMFPNPVTEQQFQLHFEETGTGTHTIQVMTLDGKIVLNKIVNISGPGQYETIRLKQDVSKGMYLVKVLNQDTKAIFKSTFILQ
jgi:hypothetical protein